ncbi:MAG: 8-oxo-dGTP diphosphatase [Streptomycetaceae bacterium]|jgi:8-oxo-dGTP pyrophosphatase MutT (NUDIX family)|nr:8-oxo-dGTP diphosphatase [Streptomycetaceae bacterium]
MEKVAWILLRDGKVLSTRNRGKDVFYFPGGKREPGESDTETLVREIDEELTVAVDPATMEHFGTYEAQPHGHPQGTPFRMICYTAAYTGTLAPANEIAEMAWLTYDDRDRVSPADQLVFDDLHATGRLPRASGREPQHRL